MWHPVTSYLHFLAGSSNEHGVHSPFVFDLVTRCFYDRSYFSEYELLDQYRKSLLSNREKICVTDFGAGSRVFRSDERKVSDIARNAGISPKRARLLFRIMRYFNVRNTLEIGTSLGLATSAMALGNPSGQVLSLEGCPNTASMAARTLVQSGIENVTVRTSEFSKSLESLAGHEYDLIYFDGNHQKNATLLYFEMLLSTAQNDSVWIFDDIHWSRDMTEAWEIIKVHPKVTVTIDTFQWGLVFFRREQEKEHFAIRV